MCDGTWIQTSDGVSLHGSFDLALPRVEDVHVEHIAHHLAQINRFTGAARRPYNVAQHSCLVARLLPPRLRLAGLLHDAHEAYTGDWSSPLKRRIRQLAPGLLEELIAPIERVIEERFGLEWLTPDDHAAIKHADLIALSTEKRDLMPIDSRPGWAESAGVVELPEPMADYTIHFPWNFADSKFNFESHFNLYTKRR
jgi:hypothetical protein